MEICFWCGNDANYKLQNDKYCCSESYNKCMSKNKMSWNKGLTKESDIRIKLYSDQKIGKSSWNKGLTKETDDRVKKISISNTGKINSDNHNKMVSDALKGKPKSLESIEKRKETRRIRQLEKPKKIKVLKERKSTKGYVRTKDQIEKFIKSKIGTKYIKINYWKKKYPLFCEIEDIIEEDRKILVKCKICGSRFNPKNDQIHYRAKIVESGYDGGYFWCSTECKDKLSYWNNPEEIIKWKVYYKLVARETYKSIKLCGTKIKDLEKRSREFHLDHKFSIMSGFRNNINAKIIGHWKNLEILKFNLNCRKLDKCSITIEQLLKEISKLGD
jgi:polyhydroxyalkanoate synthesis regulator phasin